MDQTSGTNTTGAQAAQGSQVSQPPEAAPDGSPGFRSRGRARRRARFLRRARELAYRDLGGLVYNLHRFGQRNDALVLAKLATLGHIDGEMRAIEAALGERSAVTVLREAGITACPRCAAIHGSEDRYCPNCGLPMSRHADLPVAAAAAADPVPAPQPQATYTARQEPGWPQRPAPAAPDPPPGSPPAPLASQQQPVAATPSTTADRTPLPAGGRAPVPPLRTSPPASTASPEEATEIIRPQAPGS